MADWRISIFHFKSDIGSVTVSPNWEYITVLFFTLRHLIEGLPAALWNQKWLLGTCDLRGSEVKVQAAQAHLSSLILRTKLTLSQSLRSWGALKVSFRVKWFSVQDCAAKENKRMFSIGTENYYSFIHSFIQESVLPQRRWWITTFNHTK